MNTGLNNTDAMDNGAANVGQSGAETGRNGGENAASLTRLEKMIERNGERKRSILFRLP